ncbi:hypothetical protein [Streptococcus sobrinus]|uniref:Uncharacterized protein n=1 Tax=Streptococcus sobrinus W1703 TaxID=1227275 RepID=U2J848_9STRE|nr:hypothetical protein [Streptococcus sobrinus]ERJ76222.1 hypothetical protein HMPREF1557_01116 [Streptococcus sobrinus W1703]
MCCLFFVFEGGGDCYEENPIIKLNWLVLMPRLKKGLSVLGVQDIDGTYQKILANY